MQAMASEDAARVRARSSEAPARVQGSLAWQRTLSRSGATGQVARRRGIARAEVLGGNAHPRRSPTGQCATRRSGEGAADAEADPRAACAGAARYLEERRGPRRPRGDRVSRRQPAARRRAGGFAAHLGGRGPRGEAGRAAACQRHRLLCASRAAHARFDASDVRPRAGRAAAGSLDPAAGGDARPGLVHRAARHAVDHLRAAPDLTQSLRIRSRGRCRTTIRVVAPPDLVVELPETREEVPRACASVAAPRAHCAARGDLSGGG